MIKLLKKYKLYRKLKKLPIDDVLFENMPNGFRKIDKGVAGSYTKYPLHTNLRFYPDGNHSDYKASNVEEFGKIHIINNGHTILIYDNGKRIRRPIWKYVFGAAENVISSNNNISKIQLISKSNETLLKRIEDEITSLKKDQEHYVSSGLEEQYQKTFDILMMNKSLVYSRNETVSMALLKARNIQLSISKTQMFIANEQQREERVKLLSQENLRLHSQTASSLMIIESKVQDIASLRHICDGLTPISDQHKLLSIKESISTTEADFKKIFEEFENM